MDTDQLNDEELAATAYVWRRRALHGDRSAGGIANELEKQLRRRTGKVTMPDELDTRPLPGRLQAKRRWWRLWSAR
jgi:hypothetical protein